MHDDMSKNPGKQFADYEQFTPNIQKKIKKFVKSGDFNPVNKEQYLEATLTANERESKLGHTLLFKPKEFIG